MKKVLFILAAGLVLTGNIDSSFAQPKTCQDLLDNNLYRCQVKQEGGAEFKSCFQFISPGSASSEFDLDVNSGAEILGCSCQATGSFTNPKFDASDAFICSYIFGADAIVGRVSRDGKTIKSIDATNFDGFSAVAVCQLDPACTP